MTSASNPPLSGSTSNGPGSIVTAIASGNTRCEVLPADLCLSDLPPATVHREGASHASLPVVQPLISGEDAAADNNKSASQTGHKSLEDSQQTQGIFGPSVPCCPVANSTTNLSGNNTLSVFPFPVSRVPSQEHTSRTREADESKAKRKRNRRSAFPLQGPDASSAIINKRPANLDVPPVAWRRLDERTKYQIAAEMCQVDGCGVAVTLNLGVAREQSYMTRQNRTRIRRLFQNSLNRPLKEVGQAGLEYALVFEVFPEGRLHLHGVFLGTGLDSSALMAIKTALREAAGKIKGKAAARQVHFQRLYSASGWATYTWKACRTTAKALGGDQLMIMSRSMGRLARDFHQETREKRRAA